MAVVKLVKQLDLSEFGKEWEGCFISYRTPSYGEVKEGLLPSQGDKPEKMADVALTFLQKQYETSLIPTDTGKRALEVKELHELPVEVIMKWINAIVAVTAGGSATDPLSPPSLN